MKSFIEHLKLYVRIQIGLWTALLELLSAPVDSMLLNVPKTGVIEYDGKTWIFKKHGLGVLFEEKNGKRKIDLHRAENGPASFDAWALSTYFGSLGGEGRKPLQDAGVVSGPLEDNLKIVLSRLQEDNVIEGKDGFYKLI